MARNVFSRRDRPFRQSLSVGNDGAAREVQEFVRLYMEVDEDGRRILEQLVRRSTERPCRHRTLH